MRNIDKIKRVWKGKEPEYKKLKVSELRTADYQRGYVCMKKVKEYAANFDWDLFETPLVSYRDGEYWIIDGQHRIETLKILGIETVFCKVLTGLTYEEEAMKFHNLNTARKMLNAIDKFHSRVEAKEKTALEINEILSKNKLTYVKKNKPEGFDKISAISAIESIYNDCGAKHLDRVLSILKSAWYGENDAFGCRMPVALSTYLKNSRGVKDGILISALERRTPEQIMTEATIYASKNNLSMASGRNTKQFHIAKVIKDDYNAEKKRLQNCSII